MTRKVVRGGDRIPAPDRVVSEFDLCVGDETIKKVYRKLGLEYVLHNLWGFDNTINYEGTGNFYEIQEKEHVTLDGKRVVGKRYVGKERLDDAWILEGNPSEAAKIAARQDMSYVREIAGISRQIKGA